MSSRPSPLYGPSSDIRPLTGVLDDRAARTPDQLAYRFLADGEETETFLSYGDLAREARAMAGGLVRAGASGKPVLLAAPPGLGFVTGLFACWYAGAIAVPIYPPRGNRHRHRFDAVLRDSGATLALGSAQPPRLPAVRFLDHTAWASGSPWDGPALENNQPCLLQYTSGSTSDPKGVMIHHPQLRHHLAATASVLAPLDLRSGVSWLPPYHDMGLILKLLAAMESGFPMTLLSPDHFIQRPVRWLRAISRYRADFSGGPNFAFDLCLRSIRDEEIAGLDLSCWRAAPCGAERVRFETLRDFTHRFAPCGFQPEAFLPGYGLAEATLTVTACRPGEPQRVSDHLLAGRQVSCGRVLEGTRLRIADPDTGRTLPAGEIGEIRVRGPAVAAGYWNRPEATAAAFTADGELLTGDRGYLENNELHVVGRIKDLIILGGVNLAPEDIESAVLSSVPGITAAAAFADERPEGEGVVLAVESGPLATADFPALCATTRRAVSDALDIVLQRILCIRAGTLPRTTSGKIRRAATREALAAGKLAVTHDEATEIRNSVTPGQPLLHPILEAVREVTGRPGARADDDLVTFGLSSIEATRLAARLRSVAGIEPSHAELFSARSFGHLATMLEGKPASPVPAIKPGAGRDSGILTHSQERMWFLHQLDAGSAAYHVFGALKLDGCLDPAALNRAYAALLDRHIILRSRHVAENGRPRVVISDEAAPPVETRDTGADALDPILRSFALRPFDLAHAPPVRALLITRGKDRHILALCAHHIVADGWSVRLLVRDLTASYADEIAGNPPASRTPAPDYLDYAAWHRRWIDGGSADRQTAYWKGRLAGHSGVMELATDFPRPARPSSAGASVEKKLPEYLVEQIAALARSRRATPFMVQLAAFLLLLRRHGADDDPVVAVPVANRNHPAAGELVGTLVNTLPFRLTLDPDEPFPALLDRVRDAAFEMQAAQDAPFERIIDAVRPERARDRSPLAQVMFDHQEIPLAETWAGGLRCRPHLAHRGAVQFDLSLMVFVLSDRQQLVLEYRSDLFRPETAELMLARYLSTLESICRAPDQAIRAIDCRAGGDREPLRGQGAVRPDFPRQTTPSRIAATCARLPSRPALVCGGESLTYAGFDSRSSALAASLQDRGVRSGDRVAILLRRDLNLPIALLAVWKAGAAYVPLDSANPPERLAMILEDQAPLHILVSPDLLDRLPPDTASIVFDPAMTSGERVPDAAPSDPSDPAYMIYTSGSTGRPKGVVVSHGALANFLLSMAEEPGFREGERLLAVTTVSFDISALEIFLPLVAGGTVDLVPSRVARDPAALLARLSGTRPDVLQATPATWRMLIEAGWQGSPDLRILCGGEAMDLPLARKLATLGREAWNLYGPTETTVWSSLWRVPENPERVSIGHPIANTALHVAGDDGTPLPPGVPGQLLISGAGLAEGYWNRPDLTGAAFLDTPGAPRLYRTGDLARWHPDGSLECLGRSDGQVKIRGFRVELGEIDATLLSHIGIAEAAAVLHGDKLVAWYRPAFHVLDSAELAAFLGDRLPDYMVPAPLVAIDHMPLTSSGKIDRKALAARPLPAPEARSAAPPAGVLENELAAIWSEVLDCRTIGPDDDFFALGGHSLLAARLVAEASRRLGVTVALDWLFDRPTPSGMAARIRADAAPDLARPRLIPLSQGKGGIPLFWVHTLVDGGMGLLPYRETARLLADVTDSYGIAEGTRGFSSMAEMAAAHVEEIRAIRPRGPYRLAGFCFGGNLAAEIASQLGEAGETVDLLVLLESSPPGSAASPALFLHPATWARILRRLPGRVASLSKKDPAAALRRLRMKQRAAASAVTRPGIPDLRAILDLELLDAESQERALAHWEALHRHPPRLPRAGRLVLIRAEDEGWLPRSPTLGWKSTGSIEVHTVPGRHEEFLRHHSANDVAHVLRRLLTF